MKKCPNNHSNPDKAQFCRICGHRFEDTSSLPFHVAHPEYHLRPISEFSKLFFWRNSPDYVEDPGESEVSDYFFIAKDSKFGILYWHFEKHWYGDKNDFHRMIQCEYDKIEKKDRMFVCYKGSERVFIDLKGNIMK